MAKSRKAGTHNKKVGNVRNIAKISKIADKRSIKLRTSPLKINNPFKNNNPEQNNKNKEDTSIPNISIMKTRAEAISIAPNIFTKTIL